MTEEEFAARIWPILAEASGEDLPDNLGLDVEFRDVNGDSLALVEALGILEDELGRPLDNRFFGVRTPRDLLELINALDTEPA